MGAEPAFPHLPPSADTRTRYGHLFEKKAVREPTLKVLFDRAVGVILLLLAVPFIAALFVIHTLMSILMRSQRGPLLISYKAISRGTTFRKYKFCVVKEAYIDRPAAAAGDWHAYSAEWDPRCRTYLGALLKKFYLDELPQLVNVALGQMSLVGPRPLATHHYDRDLLQGNVHRKLLRAGLFGPSQALKGTPRYGQQDDEYKYLNAVNEMSPFRLILYDFKLIILCMLRVAQGKGL
ncbi:MAG: sugar transferase [Rhizobiales bacterium]|nr:sugar transferase [Hyphomicrobiales bacterium]